MNNLQIIVDELAVKQAELDKHVNERFGIEWPAEYSGEKLLALKVELGELANETRCFKFWCAKDPSEKEVILEELVDCIHFTLSIGLLCNYLLESDTAKRLYYPTPFPFFTEGEQEYKKDLTKLFNQVFQRIGQFEFFDSSYIAYIKLLQEVLNLAAYLGFTEQEIYEGYIAKNIKNHERQNNQY